MKTSMRVFGALLVTALAAPGLAQSANTATLVVVVVDQTGAVVNDAKVTVINRRRAQSVRRRRAPMGPPRSSALSLTGTYSINVTKTGFTAEDVTDIALRAGETATVRVKLVASGGKTEVTVYGTTQGVRGDAQIGRRLDTRRSTRRRFWAVR